MQKAMQPGGEQALVLLYLVVRGIPLAGPHPCQDAVQIKKSVAHGGRGGAGQGSSACCTGWLSTHCSMLKILLSLSR